ncbi:hypothetical protein [Silvimonas iriomotensis]|uniref:Uncharacterized protein n=1 Tax=Silvimonas iriomotensis TaxID=449662 RepID=A0ABQ2P4N4_9NEIS|nr:hypothetical protein [Silvimonas iriomotensis]GGP17736.1 hypothetical protein GCM10010970_01290 [Silvimonas iriomotensis]
MEKERSSNPTSERRTYLIDIHKWKMRKKSKRNEQTKDLIEHLRNVHFSLVAASFALMIAALATPSQSLSKAIEETKKAILNSGGIFSQTSIDKSLTRKNGEFYILINEEKIIIPEIQQSILIMWEGANLPDASSSSDLYPKRENEDSKYGITNLASIMKSYETVGGFLENIETLEKFKKYYISDFSLNRVNVYIDGEKKEIEQSEIRDYISKIDGYANPGWYRTSTYFSFQGGIPSPDERSEIIMNGNLVFFLIPDVGIEKTVSTTSHRVSINIPFMLHIGNYNQAISKNELNQDYREFSYYSKDLRSLSLHEFQNYLDSLERSGNQKIQIFGIELQQSDITSWGMAALVACQIYLLLHLIEGKKTGIDLTCKFPWIGVYDDFLSICFSHASIFIFPIATVCVLLWRNIESGEFQNRGNAIFDCIMAFFALVISIASFFFMPGKRRSLREKNHSHPLFRR